MLLLLLSHTTRAKKGIRELDRGVTPVYRFLTDHTQLSLKLSTCQRSFIPNPRSSIRKTRKKKHDVFGRAEFSAAH